MGKNIFSGLLIMLFTSVSFAGTSTWIASGGGSWTDPFNWDVQPVNGDLVVFNLSSGGTVTITDVPTITLEKITVNNTGSTTLVLTGTSAVTISIDDPADNVATIDIIVASTALLTIGSNVTLKTIGSDIRGSISGTLNIESGGTLNMASAEAIFSGAGTFNVNSGGTMIIGSINGISTLSIGNIQTTTRTFNTAGNYTYTTAGATSTGSALPATVNNLTIASAGNNVTLSQNVTVSGTLDLNAGALVISTRTLTLNGPLTVTSGTLTGGSTSNLSIGGSGSSITIPAISGNLASFTINRAAGVTLGANLLVDGNLNCTNGIINTGAFTLTHGLTIQRTVTRTTGYVLGTLARYINTTTGNRTFVLGNATQYRPIVVNYTAAPTTGGLVTIKYTDGPESVPLSPSLDDGGYTVNRRSDLYYTISYGAISGGTITFTITANGFSGINNPSLLRIVRSADNGVSFGLVGNHSNGSGVSAVRSGIPGGTAGNYYMASQMVDNPLPITLSYFKLQPAGQQVFLSWRTAMEVDNAGFELFRSTDAVTFELVTSYKTNSELTGMGQSNIGKDYHYTDNALKYGQNYCYKLVDVSVNGDRKEYPVKWINLAEPNLFPKNVRLIAVAPNSNSLTYSFEVKKDNYVSVELYNQTGQLVATPIKHIFIKAGSYNKEMVIGKLAAGTYILQIKTPAGNDLKRFVITAK